VTRDLERGVLNDLTGVLRRTVRERAEVFAEPPSGTVEDRWHVYAHGYLTRLAETLESDYPTVRRILGAEPFEDLVERYLETFPPRSFDLGRAGDRLPEFLETDPLSAGLPFLPDLALLERALAEAFVAEDAVPLTWSDVQALDPEGVAGLPLVLSPGTKLIRSPWPLGEIWESRRVKDDDVEIDLEGRPANVLVWRRGLRACCQSLDADLAAFVEGVTCAGVTLSMLQTFLDPAATEAGTRSLLAAFQSLVAKEIFAFPRGAGSSGATET
jgi:hypothetical protein